MDTARSPLTHTQRIVSIGKHLKGALRMGPSDLLDVPLFEQVFAANGRIERFTSYEHILGMLEYVAMCLII